MESRPINVDAFRAPVALAVVLATLLSVPARADEARAPEGEQGGTPPAWLSIAAEPVPAAPPGYVPRAPATPEEDSGVVETWWFWAGMAAIVTTLVVVVIAAQKGSPPKTTLGNMEAFR